MASEVNHDQARGPPSQVSDSPAQGTEHVDVEMVKSYAQDLRSLLEETGFTESKTFLRSFIKRIVINGENATIHYNLPMPPDGKKKQSVRVLPIDTLGGAGGIRTPYLLTASQTFSRVNYGPKLFPPRHHLI